MEHGFLKVAAITPEMRVADTVFNREQICQGIKEAYGEGAKVAVFPELCISGYTCGDLFLQERLLTSCKEELVKIIQATDRMDILVFVGLPLEKDGKLYDVAAAIHNGKLLCFIPKTFIPAYGEFYETRYFYPGNTEPVLLPFGGGNIPFGTNILLRGEGMEGLFVGCEICEDLWMADAPGIAHAMAGATLLVNLSASNETIGKDVYREMLVKAASAKSIAGYVYCSSGEGESTQDLVFGGHDIIAENGTVLAQSKQFTAQIVYGEVDISRIRMERRRKNVFGRHSQYNYLTIPFVLKKEQTVLSRSFPCLPFVPTDLSEREKRCEEILSIQSVGLKKRYAHTGCRKAVVGVSGGLDSTLALLVTVRAFDMLGLPRENVIAVTMPCFGTTGRTYRNACKLVKALGASLREVDIREAVTGHFKDIGKEIDEHDVVYENGQARERTQVLMDIANQEQGMVIGTGDMSELALGWATYNGDHMSMYGVNAGVPKTLVRHLVQYYADTCTDTCMGGDASKDVCGDACKDSHEDVCEDAGGNVDRKVGLKEILQDVLDTPVSPELLPPKEGRISQRTEELVGPYELHDFFLYYMLRWGYTPAKIYRIASLSFAGQYEDEVILKWMKVFYKRFFNQQFKRSCLPDGPKVGSVALSPRGDLRMPSDACVRIWMDEVEELG